MDALVLLLVAVAVGFVAYKKVPAFKDFIDSYRTPKA